MADASANTPLPTIPKSWPGAFGAYKHSKQAVRNVLLNLILLYVALVVISFFLGLITGNNQTLSLIWQIVSNILSVIVGAMFIALYLGGARDQKMTIAESWEKVKPNVVKYFLLMVLLAFIAMGTFLLFIVPFFIVMPRLFMAPYLLLDKNMGIFDSINASWEQTKGNVGKIWGVIGASIVMILPVFTIIGIPFAIYFSIMYSAAQIVLYFFITDNYKAPKVAAE